MDSKRLELPCVSGGRHSCGKGGHLRPGACGHPGEDAGQGGLHLERPGLETCASGRSCQSAACIYSSETG